MSEENQQETPEVELNKTYEWQPQDKIEITGIEFSILQKTIAMFEVAYPVTQAIFLRMLKDGIAAVREEIPEQAEQEFTPEATIVDEHVPHVD